MKNEDTTNMESKQPLEARNRVNIVLLENRIKNLEKSVRILDVIAQRYAKQVGIKVERFADGLVVISQI